MALIMAAFSAPGVVAGAGLPQDAPYARRRALNAPKVRFCAPFLPTRRVAPKRCAFSQGQVARVDRVGMPLHGDGRARRASLNVPG